MRSSEPTSGLCRRRSLDGVALAEMRRRDTRECSRGITDDIRRALVWPDRRKRAAEHRRQLSGFARLARVEPSIAGSST